MREVACSAAATSIISEVTAKIATKFLDQAIGLRSIPSPAGRGQTFNLRDATRYRDIQDALAVILGEEEF